MSKPNPHAIRCLCGHAKSYHWEKSGCSQCSCARFREEQHSLPIPPATEKKP
jgi:hypothetical protein